MALATDALVERGRSKPGPQVSLSTPGDFFALLKPRVMSLVVFTAFTGLMLAPSRPHPVIAFISILAIAVGAGAAGCLNMWWDADIDALMSRTRNRPIPAGRITRETALGFGLMMAAGSVITLGLAANWMAAGLLAFTIFFYIVVYSMWLKRSTPQNIVIGGAAGALPPVIGYAAATADVTLGSAVLFAIIFLWTPPHSWALALFRSQDYARAKVPMLPVAAGRDATRMQILVYTLVLVPAGATPALLGLGGLAYGLVALLMGAGMLHLAFRLYCQHEEKAADLAAKKLFGFSILYLSTLFGVLLVERIVALVLQGAG